MQTQTTSIAMSIPAGIPPGSTLVVTFNPAVVAPPAPPAAPPASTALAAAGPALKTKLEMALEKNLDGIAGDAPARAPSDPARSGQRWSQAEDDRLQAEVRTKMAPAEMARTHQRKISAIKSRLVHLGVQNYF